MTSRQLLVPRVGIGVLVVKDGKILLGKRKGSHGEGEYSSPGGNQEYMESFEDCARREVREETGGEIVNIRGLHVLNVLKYAPKHYVHIGLIADWAGGEAKVMEPDKVESWGWYDLNDLPFPLFGTMPTTLEALLTGRWFWDREPEGGR
jgi:8-oxo-dGTP diphosphatase